MEEKERYEVISNKKNFIEIQDIESNVDTFITEDTIEDLLNQQSKRIKELEQENQQLKLQLAESKEENKKLVKALNGDIFINYKVPMENAKLKQQLHDLPKKIVEDCKMALIKRINIISGYGRMTIDEQSFFFENEYGKDLDTILKKFGGENEGNND